MSKTILALHELSRSVQDAFLQLLGNPIRTALEEGGMVTVTIEDETIREETRGILFQEGEFEISTGRRTILIEIGRKR